jgi:uncharacterized membrane protein
MNSSRKIVIMQWIVIAVLIVGGVAGGLMMVRKTDQLQEEHTLQQSNVNSLREQLRQARTPQTPLPTPLPEAASNAATPTPSPAPAATPKAATPKPTATPRAR